MNLASIINKNKLDIMIAIIAVVLMLVGFLFNRVVSNIGFGFAGLYTLMNLYKTKNLWQDRWIWSFIALATIPLLSDIVNEGWGFLKFKGIMKMLLVLFPAFIYALHPDDKQIKWLHWAVILTMLVSTIYSLFNYFSNYEEILASYKVSKVLPVLAKGDHIRISWATSISVLMAMYLYVYETSKTLKFLQILYIGLQIVFLHILGAKTGLLTLYVMIAVWIFWSLPGKKKWMLGLVVPIGFMVLFSAYKFIPSWQERVNFMRYDFEHYRKGEYRPGLSDAVRVYSIKAGWQIFKDNYVTGVGFSKLHEETINWYNTNMPTIEPQSRFIPISQTLIYMASVGILGIIVVIWHLFMPFFVQTLRNNRWFMAFFIPLIMSFFYESHLEGQFAIFVYGFFISWFWYLAIRNSQSQRIIVE